MIERHNEDYKKDAWHEYSLEELGAWVSLLSKRATHRSDLDKAQKDMYDAKNYYRMMGEMLKEISERIGIDFEQL